MDNHTIRIERQMGPSELHFSPIFNVAVPFIDRHITEGRGAKLAIRSEAGDVTYAQLAANVNRAANALRKLDVAPGQRMLMVVKDCAEFFYLFWGAIKAGVVPVPLNTLLRASDYAYMIEDSACAVFVYSQEFAGESEAALAAAKFRPDHVLKCADFGQGLATESDKFEAQPATATTECFWNYSSGSTGRPKGTVHCHRDIPVTAQCYAVDVLGAKESDIFFSAAKLFFAYGMGNGMTFPLWVGGTSVLLEPRPTPESTFATIAKFKPTLYFGVPTLYAAQLASLETSKPDLASIRYCVSAGEALPGDIYRRWKETTGLHILDGIGSTEALHIFISNRPDDIKPGTSGRIVPGYEARIVGEDGHVLPPGESGKLHIRGASTATYYWNQPEKTQSTMLADGWLNTGDTYILNEDGHFQYCGRSDDMMKVGGIWCSPFEIEARLVEHPKVLEAAIVGRGDDDGLIKPEAWIVLKDQRDASETMEGELREHCKKGLAPYKYPRWFHFVEELPKTATGKIQRFKLRQH
ncbi:MAG: benzoate-CoA ligase family protein [Alphaproteobacteria bacterium]|nr:benzoate-CoA ligase family protein [Alphaproteobacteria bacterium]